MKYNPFQAYELNPITFDDVTGHIMASIKAELVDMEDKVIVDAVVRAAQEAGITTLYLLDKQFVMNAIREKLIKERGAE